MKNFLEWVKENHPNDKLLKKEMAGADAIVSSCKPGADYQVQGSCSNIKKKKKKK